MQTAVENLLVWSAARADALRGRILKRSMTVPVLRSIYCQRSLRHATWLLACVAVYLPLALFFPLVLLVVGPVVYGVPHLFASVRYVNRALGLPNVAKSELPRVAKYLIVSAAVVAAAKLLLLLRPEVATITGTAGFIVPELALMAVVVIVFGSLTYRLPFKQLLPATLLLSGFSWISLDHVAVVAGVMAIAHNFVAFGYWVAGARERRERLVAVGATALFAAIHVAIFLGALDFVYGLHAPGLALASFDLSFQQIGLQVAPWSADPRLWLHGAVAFAFGQAVHYFVWLKVIPEQNHSRQVPACFSQSLRALKQDFGQRLALGICVATLLFFGVWVLTSMPQARLVYFAVASFHGYLEIAGLFVLAASALPRLAPHQPLRVTA